MITSITRQFDEDMTVLRLGLYRVVLTCRPIRRWHRCQWSLFKGYELGDRFQCPWFTCAARKDDPRN